MSGLRAGRMVEGMRGRRHYVLLMVLVRGYTTGAEVHPTAVGAGIEPLRVVLAALYKSRLLA